MTSEQTIVLDATRRAAKVCDAIYHSLITAAEKVGREPVTIADYASQTIISHTLRKAFPDDAILGEEHANDFDKVLTPEQQAQVARYASQGTAKPLTVNDVRDILTPPNGTSGRTWSIDPIDGTKGFVAKRAYAIAIALLDGDKITLGALGCPNLSPKDPSSLTDQGVIFYGDSTGAYQQNLSGGALTQIHVANTTPHDPIIISTSYEKKHSDQDLVTQVLNHLPSPDKQTIGLDGQGKYGLVAAGSVSCYFRRVPDPNYREKVWDHAAGAIIVEAAGGKVTDFDGKPLDFSQGKYIADHRGIVASNGSIHDALLAAFQAGDTP